MSTPFPGLSPTPRSVLHIAVVLALDEAPAHGYDLLTRFVPLGLVRSNPGIIYRALHWLEIHDFITAAWDTTGSRPPRKIYTLTEAGTETLNVDTAALVTAAKAAPATALSRYVLRQLQSYAKVSFSYTVRFPVAVAARNETTAQAKLDRVLAKRQRSDISPLVVSQILSGTKRRRRKKPRRGTPPCPTPSLPDATKPSLPT